MKNQHGETRRSLTDHDRLELAYCEAASGNFNQLIEFSAH